MHGSINLIQQIAKHTSQVKQPRRRLDKVQVGRPATNWAMDSQDQDVPLVTKPGIKLAVGLWRMFYCLMLSH